MELLIEASKNGNIDKIKQLLKDGVDVNVKKNDQFTPLLISSQNSKWY